MGREMMIKFEHHLLTNRITNKGHYITQKNGQGHTRIIIAVYSQRT